MTETKKPIWARITAGNVPLPNYEAIVARIDKRGRFCFVALGSPPKTSDTSTWRDAIGKALPRPTHILLNMSQIEVEE